MRKRQEIFDDMFTDEARVPEYKLPSPLVFSDGREVKNAFEWCNKRRPEILALFQREMYGAMPGRPDVMRFELLSYRDDALNGIAIRKEIRIHCSMNDGRCHYFDLLLYLPVNAKKKVPAFLGLNFKGNQACTLENDVAMTWGPVINPGSKSWYVNEPAAEETRGLQSGRWGFEEIIKRGYASATIHYSEIFPDLPEGFSESIFKLFYSDEELASPDKNFGAIGAWAWGLSRALDYLESDPDIDSARVAVHGHSRLGKTALWAGACDSRFAAVISNNSGCGGAALSMRGFGENLEWLLFWRTYWFNPALCHYIRNENKLPFDQHWLIALAAPRPVYVASADEDHHADPKGEFLAALNAAPVYQLFGVDGINETSQPLVNQPVGDEICYHLRAGVHNITSYDWARYLDFADRLL